MLRADLHPRMPPDNGGGCAAVQHLTFFEKCAAGGTGMRGIRPRAGVLFVQRCSTLPFLRSVPQAAPGCGVSAPARRVPFRMHEKGPKVHIRGVPLMYPPEGCPPLAGWKRHACQCPPQPVFCPDRPRPIAPGCTAKPHYTVPDRAELPSLPGEFSQEGGTAAPLVGCAERLSRPWPRFAPARESREWGRFGLEPKTPRTFKGRKKEGIFPLLF